MISPDRTHELLQRYAASRCGHAFRELIEGYTGMVHATALRVLRGNAALAQDVTQAVFSLLAAAPQKVRHGKSLGAWLHAAAVGHAADVVRAESRRRRREEASVLMNTPDSTASAGPDQLRELAPEIDGALNSLRAEDCQMLLLRYWQQQDWRSIGAAFGLSDDAAQKRIGRALERLRKILERRGITSTAGALSTALAATVPRDLPAALISHITSVAQTHAAAKLAASPLYTALAMTSKTKVALVSAAFAIAAIAPAVFQQRRISGLERELSSLREQLRQPAGETAASSPHLAAGPAAVPSRTSAATFSVGRGKTGGIRISPGNLSVHAKVLAGEHSALNADKIVEKLAALRTRLSLTAAQEEAIRAALEEPQPKLHESSNGAMMMKLSPGPEETRKMEEKINAVLTAEQKEAYAGFLREETANRAEAIANRELAHLQSITTLTNDQKDQTFAALSKLAMEEAAQPMPEPFTDGAAIEASVEARWQARHEALSRILTAEQLAVYQNSGNPNRAVTISLDAAKTSAPAKE